MVHLTGVDAVHLDTAPQDAVGQSRGELVRDGGHARGGHAHATANEAAPDQVDIAARRVQLVLAQHTGEERPQEVLEPGPTGVANRQRLSRPT